MQATVPRISPLHANNVVQLRQQKHGDWDAVAWRIASCKCQADVVEHCIGRPWPYVDNRRLYRIMECGGEGVQHGERHDCVDHSLRLTAHGYTEQRAVCHALHSALVVCRRGRHRGGCRNLHDARLHRLDGTDHLRYADTAEHRDSFCMVRAVVMIVTEPSSSTMEHKVGTQHGRLLCSDLLAPLLRCQHQACRITWTHGR